MARGIRNNNPGNIEYSPNTNWLGLDSKNPSDGRFCRFKSPEYGIRALTRILKNYTKRDGTAGIGLTGIDTVYEIIHRWAPPSENNTDAYVKSVASALGVDAKQHIELTEDVLLRLVKAIILHENGTQPYDDAVILTGVKMA